MIINIIFFISLFGIIFLFVNKRREMLYGKPFMNLSFGSDYHIKQKIEGVRVSAKNFPRKAAHITAFYAVKHGITAFEKTKQIVYPKISHIIDAVKGRDIPKNKGSASLFLKHIEEFKNKKQA